MGEEQSLGLLSRKKLLPVTVSLLQVPTWQRPHPAPHSPQGAPVSDDAECRPLGQQASVGSLWGTESAC